MDALTRRARLPRRALGRPGPLQRRIPRQRQAENSAVGQPPLAKLRGLKAQIFLSLSGLDETMGRIQAFRDERAATAVKLRERRRLLDEGNDS